MMKNFRLDSRFTPLVEQEDSCERTCAILKVYSGDIHPDIITERLQITPTRQVAKGEYGNENSLGRAPLGKINGWFLSSEDFISSHDLRTHLDWLLSKLANVQEVLIDLQNIPELRMGVECPWWAGKKFVGGPVLWPEQMAGLAYLNLECSIFFSDYNEP